MIHENKHRNWRNTSCKTYEFVVTIQFKINIFPEQYRFICSQTS